MNPFVASVGSLLASQAIAAPCVLDHIKGKRAMSLLRLGDGEGVVLSRPDLEDATFGPHLISHFGEQFERAQLDDLCSRLALAVGRANVLGIRTDVGATSFPEGFFCLSDQERVAWVQRNLSLRPEERAQLDPDSASRLMLLGRWMAEFDWPEQALLTSAWVHFDWLESGFLADLAMGQERIGLVTGRRDLAPLFRAVGIEVDEWPVPLRYLRRDADWTPHFPDRFDELLDTLTPTFPGQLFFVGAGICGKVYCDIIAQRGGIALDIGAVCDAWLGISTRPRVAFERWGQEAVPESLLLERQLSARLGDGGAKTET
ncbi:MAG: hypothetical protein AAF358_24545 [Pseudomonadota bacterium]